MLKSVTKPNHEKVNFEYDALGRRTAKIVTQVNMRSSHPLGEMSKGQRGIITRFVWDGNVPLHEWQYNIENRPKLFVNEKGDIELDAEEPIPNEDTSVAEKLTTWVFEDGSFVPQAKIVGDKTYSIICDYLGTPVQAFDDNGEKVWECELDIYGKVRSIDGSKTFIPFRYQGQYEDKEIGLYYNRFRYYSPDSGTYISQDPIGLFGGDKLYSYVDNSNLFIDSLGLSKTPTRTLQKGWKDYVGSKHTNPDIHHGFPEELSDDFKRIADIDVNNPEYHYNLKKGQHTKKPGLIDKKEAILV